MSEQYGVGANGTSATVRQGPAQDPPAHAGPPEDSVSAITRAAFGVTLGLLQANINALWAGGAEAMSVNGQRVLTTTAIRCIGNTLLLHGRQYSPPYSVEAIGNRDALLAALDRDPDVERFRHAAQRYQLGLEVVAAGEIESPASEDLARLDRARIARDDSEHPAR
jgi:uncharacterized protein YlxW (UPF0749 family)